MTVEIIPAIDLKGGRCVRLRQGLADQETVYGEDPLAMARHWVRQGARFLHVVDLDGAFQGRPAHTAIIGRIAAEIGIPVEVGGGLRTPEDIETLLELGVARAIVGTRAVSDPDMLARMAQAFPDRIAAGIDARDGKVQVRGWVETTELSALDLAGRAEQAGVRTVIFTDTATDGMLTGVNAAAMAAMCDRVQCAVIASGGIASPADIRALRELKRPNLTGAIAGKALYEKRTTLAALTTAAREAI
jgi:phosphoribosylformimino-5-aminoimidazole carboxamide ribotide isomerase